MKIVPGKEADYAEYVRVNSDDGYSKAVVTYSERWAEMMEPSLNDEMSLTMQIAVMVKIADKMSHEANLEGITGFMYGCAVQGLSKYWAYGEALRQWHNINVQINNEGVKANESGGVLNPALLNIGGGT